MESEQTPRQASSHGALDRLLAWTGRDEGPRLRPKLDAFTLVLLVHLAAREGVRHLEGDAPWRGALAIGFLTCIAASFVRPLRRWAVYAALALLCVKLGHVFPAQSNHFLIELLCVLFVATAYREDDANLPVLARSLRWLPVLAFFFSGLQKLWSGTYFTGTYLAFQVASDERFQWAFQWILTEDELRRLTSTTPPGPYLFDGWFPVAISNAVYLGEMTVALLLLVPRTRRLGLVSGLVLVASIEVVARELFFGMLFANLLLLFSRTWNRRLLPAFLVAYAALVASKAGWLPEFTFN